jgi:hypothetical protein
MYKYQLFILLGLELGECTSFGGKSQKNLSNDLKSIAALLNTLHLDFIIGLGSGETGVK